MIYVNMKFLENIKEKNLCCKRFSEIDSEIEDNGRKSI